MARFAGDDIPNEKRTEIALTQHFRWVALVLRKRLPRPVLARHPGVADLTDEQLITLRDYLEANYKIEGDLRREVDADIRRKIQINCYQGQRHCSDFCARASTKTNARTARARSARSPERRRPPSSRWHDSGHGMIFIPSPERQQQSSLLGNEGQWQRLSKPLVSPVVATASRSRSARLTSSPLSTTRSFRSPIRPAPWCPGRPVAMSAWRPVSPRRTPLVWLPSPPPAAMEHGVKKVDVFVKGPGSGRETAIRSLQSAGLEVGSITDVTPQAHNGVRPPKRRRV